MWDNKIYAIPSQMLSIIKSLLPNLFLALIHAINALVLSLPIAGLAWLAIIESSQAEDAGAFLVSMIQEMLFVRIALRL